jgi:6-phosphogluconolactonase
MTVPEVYASALEIGVALRSATESFAAGAIRDRGRFTMALTGGSAASSLYPELSKADVAWGSVHIFFGDERCVSPDHADSNYRLAKETLLDHVAIPSENVHRIQGEIAPPAAASAYEAELATFDGKLDVVHLGMGPDGHVCSLFPGHALLLEKTKLVSSLTDSPKPPPARVTLTLRALEQAREVWFLAFGEAKAEAVRLAITDSRAESTAAIVHRTTSSRWFLDRAAASLL